MNFLNPYSRIDYKDFFQNKLLTDDFVFIEEKLSLEFKPQYLIQVELLGKDKSLELDVYEILHESENDPRVGLSKDIFRLMSKYGSKRALAILYSPNSTNYRLSLATVELSLEGSKIKREYSNPRRYSFFLGPDAKVHTPNDFLIKKGKVKDFEDLQNRFSIEVVNKEFYKEIANWYFWALRKVKFPDDAEAEKNGRNTSVIRLITRLIFIWFMKVRKLIPEDLFNEDTLKDILEDFKTNNDNYYKAILQNLFFATLNTKQNDRRFTSKKRGYKGFSNDFGNHNVFRYEEAFTNSEETIEKYFLTIPFLNGGLFECLDYKTKLKDERKYIDGFTSTKSQQPSVPNFLFFNEDKTFDLNKDYGTTNKQYEVRGLLNTLSLYNFTIDEIDPNDSDVALDPELLGKVFENLLASYNPETANTARKSTGSFYTPRLIVAFMVDESLKQYFKTHINLDDIDSKLEILFSNQDSTNPFDKSTTEYLVSLIDSLRVVDPAVGSGAFPMRLLNRLVFLLHKLDPENTLWKESQIDGVRKSVKDPIIQKQLIEQIHKKFSDKNPDYGRKLYLIEKCIYGVDIQQIAVEIAKLRFFITLLVDEKINFEKKDENYEIEPLPNLDFKLMQGNSLISSFAGIDFSQKDGKDNSSNGLFDYEENYRQLISEFEELKAQHQNESDVKLKRELKEKIDEKLLQIFAEKLKLQYPQLKELENKYSGLKEKQSLEVLAKEKIKLFKKVGIDLEQAEQDLIAYTEGRKQKDFFLWDVYFAEVFAEKNGFDIVIGNPPYVRQENIDSNFKELLKHKHPEVANGTADLYIYFFNASLKLLNSTGNLIFITLNKYLKTKYGKELRKLLKNYYSVPLIIDFFEQPVFEAATDSSITQISYKNDEIKTKYFPVKSLINLSLNSLVQGNPYTVIMDDKEWIFIDDKKESTLNKIKIDSISLKEFVNDQIYRGVTTGFNEAFIIDNSTKNSILKCDNNSAGIIKKYIRSTNIKKWSTEWTKEWLVFTRRGININDYKGIKEFLLQFKSQLSPKPNNHKGSWAGRKPGSYKWYEIQDNTAYYEEFDKPKIIYMHTAKKHEFFQDYNGYYISNSCYMIISNDKFLFCFLNSKLFDWYKRIKFVAYGDAEEAGRVKLDYNKMITVPIKNLSKEQENPFSALVDEIRSIKKQNPEADTKHLENKIDIMVFKLYNLTYAEVKIIDPEIEKIILEKEYEKFEIE